MLNNNHTVHIMVTHINFYRFINIIICFATAVQRNKQIELWYKYNQCLFKRVQLEKLKLLGKVSVLSCCELGLSVSEN